jgi:hypothetical protein
MSAHRPRTNAGIAALRFESANPSVVKSIKQRDLLNTWLRLYDRQQQTPHVEEYQPERFAEELPELVHFAVDTSQQPPRLKILKDGVRTYSAYGHTGEGRYLDEYVGIRLAPAVMPVYHECVGRSLPVYTVSQVDDARGRIVFFERLLLPFAEHGQVNHLIASLKTICDDGGFEIKNLMRGNDALPIEKVSTVIDRDLFHQSPGRAALGDTLEFS